MYHFSAVEIDWDFIKLKHFAWIKNYFVFYGALVHMIIKSGMTWKEILPLSTPLYAIDFSTFTKLRLS